MVINDDKSITFDSLEEAKQAANSPESAPEVVQVFISQDYTILDKGTPEVQDATTDEDAIIADSVSADTCDEVVAQELSVTEQASVLFESNRAKMEEAHKNQLADLRSEFEIPSEETTTPEIVPLPEKLEIKIDDGDSDLVSEYEKSTRRHLQKMNENMAIRETNVQKKLDEIDEAKKVILGEREKELKAIQAQRELDQTYLEIDTFTKGKEDLHLEVSTKVAHTKSLELHDQIEKVLGITGEGQVEKAYREIVRGDTDVAKSLRASLEKKQIKVPTYLGNFLKITDYDDARRGIQFNPVSGAYERLTQSLDDQYLIQNYDQRVSSEVEKRVASITDKLNGKETAATSLLDVEVVDVHKESTGMSYDEAKIALAVPLKQMKLNPSLAKNYADACALIGSEPPDQVKRLLK